MYTATFMSIWHLFSHKPLTPNPSTPGPLVILTDAQCLMSGGTVGIQIFNHWRATDI